MAKKKMTTIEWIATLLVIVAAINWGLVEWLSFDLVTFISFGYSMLETTIKTLAAVSGIYALYKLLA